MNTILFDLDGTLLPMNQEAFIDTFTKAVRGKFESLGYDADEIMETMMLGIKMMIENDGFKTNKECIEELFKEVYGKKAGKILREMIKFYKKEFDVAKLNTVPTPLAAECISILKEKGYQVVLATTPLFPPEAVERRMEWAGIEKEDFVLITTYDNCCYSKPNLQYYRRILKTIDKTPEDCLMVGNDVSDDMCAAAVGIDVFLIKDCLLNYKELDYSDYKQGSFESFMEYVKELPDLLA
ncbi:MAG: HAD family hydrolase [Lachnospiraceae bacterium]|nr:HAD family hydrolase [Lachnospiraceae bacterium]